MVKAELVKNKSSRAIWARSSDDGIKPASEIRGRLRQPTRVLLADDHPRVRKGIIRILQRCPDIEIVGEASDGFQALELVKQLSPDILLLDMEMPVMNGSQVAAHLKEMRSPVRILVLSAHDDRQYIQCMLEAGAAGYLIKEDVPEILIEAVKGVARGEKGWVSQRVIARLEN